MSSFTFPCIQVNLNKASLATSLLVNKLLLQDSITFLTEPYVAFNKVVAMPRGYLTIPNYAIADGPRAALILPLVLQPIAIDHLSNRDCAVALLQCNGQRFLIARAYLDINKEVAPDWLHAVSEYAESHDFPLVLCLDSNAHSQLYSDRQNERGDHMEEFILQHGLSVANFGATPTFQTFRAASQIDITLFRDINVSDWRVSTLYNASDHHSLLFSLSADMGPPRNIRPWHAADWKLFTKMLDLKYNFPARISRSKLDRLVSYMYRCIELALDKACPVVTTQPKLSGNLWFTDKLFKQGRVVRRQYKRALVVGTDYEKSLYKRLHKAFKKACRKAKSKSWRKYVSEVDSEKNMAFLAKVALHNDKRVLNLLSLPSGEISAPGIQTLNELARVHFPTAIPFIDEPYDEQVVLKEEVSMLYDEFINDGLVRSALLLFKPMKASGPDGLKPIIFKYLPDSFITLVTFIYKCCLALRYTPKLWAETKVIWLPKPDKDSYIQAKSFRPIALSNFFLKGLERLITWRMDFHLTYYPINAKQHGFTKGKSTEGALSNTVNYIEKFLLKNKHCLGLFLDIKSAYDSMDPDHIRSSLLLHGGEDDLVEWYYGYLKSRILRLSIHGDDLVLRATTGFPQGGVASAKFWLIAFNPAIDIINTCFIEGNGYADDCSAVFGGREPEILVTRLQRMLDSLVLWGASCNLSFNVEKSVVMFFTRTQTTCEIPLTINGSALEYVDVVRYLGVYLDTKLFWTAHVNNRVLKAKRFLLKMAAIAKATWGPKPHLMRWVYTCMVRPMILYGSVVWGHEACELSIPDKLKKLNRLGMATYTRFLRSTPTQALEIITDTFPLHLYTQKEALCAFIRLLPIMELTWRGYNNNTRHSFCHRKFWYDMIARLQLTEYMNVDTCYVPEPEPFFVVRLDSFEREFVQETYARWAIYSDGSRRENKVGAAYVITLDGVPVYQSGSRLSDHSTVFQAELVAIRMAAEHLPSMNFHGGVDIYVDSQSALRALRQDFIDTRVVLHTINSLNNLGHGTSLFWVKAHNGNQFNELADNLAKEATHQPVVMEEIEISKTIIRNEVLFKLREIWDVEWSEYTEARMSKMFFTSQNKVRAKEICKLSRYQLGRLIRVTTGHNQLMYFQHVVDPVKDPLCRYCRGYPETFYHWIGSCPAFDAARQHFFPGEPVMGEEWSLDRVMGFASEPRVVSALAGRDVAGMVQDPISDQESLSQSQEADDPANLSDLDFNEQGNYPSDDEMEYDSNLSDDNNVL